MDNAPEGEKERGEGLQISSDLWLGSSDPKKPFAKICIFEYDISILAKKWPKTPDFNKEKKIAEETFYKCKTKSKPLRLYNKQIFKCLSQKNQSGHSARQPGMMQNKLQQAL